MDDVTVFLQGNPFEHIQVLKGWQCLASEDEIETVIKKINIEITPETKFLSFYQVLYNVPYGTNGAKFNTYLSTNINFKYLTVSAGAQYIVPKIYILSRPLDVWKRAYDILSENINWHGYAHEISWFYLFTNRVFDCENHDNEKHKLDGMKQYGFHHTPNSWQNISNF